MTDLTLHANLNDLLWQKAYRLDLSDAEWSLILDGTMPDCLVSEGLVRRLAEEVKHF